MHEAVDGARHSPAASRDASPTAATAASLSVALIVTLALQSAVPPLATDMYTPAFPAVGSSLGTSAAVVGLTLTLFFAGFGAGQLIGGPVSDRWGRKTPLIVGGILCTIGAVGCALAPTAALLVAMRFVQGFGGGVAATVARAVLIDVARGQRLAKVMSLMMALVGLAPVVAPVIGGAVLTLGGSWRVIFWVLTGFGVLMVATAIALVPETLPSQRRHAGGIGALMHGISRVLRVRAFVGFMLVGALSGFAMFGYIANAAYVLQVMRGMAPMPFAVFFAGTALCQVAASVVNARLIGRFQPQRLIAFGLSVTVAAVALLIVSVLVWDAAIVPTCLGFILLMTAQAFVFGNAAALAASAAADRAGAASGVMGVTQSVAAAISAPLASAGGGATAVPMIVVMIIGATLAVIVYALTVRAEKVTPAT